LFELNNQTGSQNSVNNLTLAVTASLIGIVGGLQSYTASLKNVGIVSSSNQLLELNNQTGSQDAVNNLTLAVTSSLIGIVGDLQSYTASLKGATIVSSSNQLLDLNNQTGSQNSINNLTSAVTSSILTTIYDIQSYTASLKGAAIVSSSQQITNYYKFAETASANTFYGNQSIRGNAIINGGNSVRLYESTNTNYWDAYTYTDNTLRVNYNGAGGDEIILYNDGGINFSGALTASIYKVNSGGGIDFSATSNGSGTMTSELLNDYEEGTWTPVIRGSGTAGTYELQTDYTTYTKIGRQVTVSGNIRLGSVITGGGTGYLQITGLPFQKVANTAAMGSVLLNGIDFTGSYVTISFTSISASSILYLAETVDNSTPIDLPISAVAANDEIAFTITYFN
jgi:hypothetical protein